MINLKKLKRKFKAFFEEESEESFNEYLKGKIISKAHNTVNLLSLYRTPYGVWCFDDEDLGIYKEPFVGEINDICDILADGGDKFSVFISHSPIHEFTIRLNKREELGVGMYQVNREDITEWEDITGWLCPCLLNYFEGSQMSEFTMSWFSAVIDKLSCFFCYKFDNCYFSSWCF